jgi:hypothetical protein
MKVRTVYSAVLLAALLLVFAPMVGHACSCMDAPCNPAWKRGEVVFLGEVTAKETIPRAENNATYSLTGRVAVHFSVHEMFAGQLATEKDTVIFTGTGGGDCGYPFAVGQTYLVYANKYQERLTTGICSPTRPAVTASALLEQLRALTTSPEPATLFGMIGTAPRGNGYGDLIESKALPNVRVRAISSKGSDYSVTSNGQGAYSFSWLPADTYRLEIDLPSGLSTWQQDSGKALSISIGNDQKSRGCSVDVFARPDGRISGVVVDPDGTAVPGFVTIVSADPPQGATDRQRAGLVGFESSDGKFLLTQIPPGRYRLLFYPKINGQVSFRNAPARSEPIDIGFGQHVENYQFKVSN